MELTEKYISEKENLEKPDAKRVLVSNDAFSIVDAVQQLINKLEHARSSLRK